MSSLDQQYIAYISKGESSGLNTIYQTFFPNISRFIQSNGGSVDDAKDVFQDAIVVIYTKSQQADFQLTSKFSTLLMGVCRNLWGNVLQKKSRSGVIKTDLSKYKDNTDIQSLIENEEISKLFWDSFQKLGADCQKVLQLFFEKKKMTEIQQIMGFGSLSYTKKRKFSCKEKLVDLVKKDHRFVEMIN